MRIACLSVLFVLSSIGPVLAGGACKPVDGLKELLEPGRVFVLGELHGTEQSPSYTFMVACNSAASGHETIIGLELTSAAQPWVDRYLASAGTDEDRAALLDHDIWTRAYQDGRTSRAIVGLIEQVRQVRNPPLGLKLDVLFYDVAAPRSAQDRDHGMAGRLAASMKTHPGSVHVVLTGNLHSRVTPGFARNRDYRPMGNLLLGEIAPKRLISFDVAHTGGTAWICAPDCGVVQLGGRPSKRRWSFEVDESTRPSGHHGWYHVGELTASLPAIGDHEMPDEEAMAAAAKRHEAARKKKPAPEPERESVPADSPEIKRLQGRWQSYYDGAKSWWIEFDGRSFYAEMSPDDWYRGEVFLRPDDEPAEMDLLIQDCRCGYKGASSDGIYKWQGESIRLDAPSPGDPRPESLGQRSGEGVTLVRIGKKPAS